MEYVIVAQSLDASRMRLDGAFLVGSDLNQIWMREASLENADLMGVHLSQAYLRATNLSLAHLSKANLNRAFLTGANLRRAFLMDADLSGADLSGADLSGADLSEAYLSGANLSGVLNLEEVLSLKDTDLRGAKGLTKEQLEACKAKGAIIYEDTTTSPPQPPVSPLPPSQSSDAQAHSVPPVRVNTPPPTAAFTKIEPYV